MKTTKNDYSLKNIQVIGYTRDFNQCECCGKQDLRGTVVILDLNYGVELHFGTTCAAKADKYDSLEALRLAKEKVTSLKSVIKSLEDNSYKYAHQHCREFRGADNYLVEVNKAAKDYYDTNIEKATFLCLNAAIIKEQTVQAKKEFQESEEYAKFWEYVNLQLDRNLLEKKELNKAFENKRNEIQSKYPYTKYSYIS